MLRLEKRPEVSRRMVYLSPLIAVVLMLFGGLFLFAILGKNPIEGFRVISDALVERRLSEKIGCESVETFGHRGDVIALWVLLEELRAVREVVEARDLGRKPLARDSAQLLVLRFGGESHEDREAFDARRQDAKARPCPSSGVALGRSAPCLEVHLRRILGSSQASVGITELKGDRRKLGR